MTPILHHRRRQGRTSNGMLHTTQVCLFDNDQQWRYHLPILSGQLMKRFAGADYDVANVILCNSSVYLIKDSFKELMFG